MPLAGGAGMVSALRSIVQKTVSSAKWASQLRWLWCIGRCTLIASLVTCSHFQTAPLMTPFRPHLYQGEFFALPSIVLSFFRRRCGGVFTLFAIIYAGLVCGAWQPSLTSDEAARAVDMVLKQEPAGFSVKRSHPLGVQVLLVERREIKHAVDEQIGFVEVFLFDYIRNATQFSLVDLAANMVVETTDINSAHLPLTEQEISHSKAAISNHYALSERVRRELGFDGNSASTEFRIADLQARVSVWVPETSNHADISRCDHERCALISLFTSDDYSISVEPVVNLQSGEVFIDLFQ